MIESADAIRVSVGIVGTGTTALLADVGASATIFAGFCTGCYMLVAMALKIKEHNRRRDD